MRILFLLLFAPVVLNAQTFTGTGGLIPDDGTVTDFPITVSGLTPSTLDANNGLISVCLNITHTWNSDLDIRLISPDGTGILLISGIGGSDDDFLNTCLDMSAGISIVAGTAPFTGNYLPLISLGNANNGQNGNGTWILRIVDTYPADQGNLIDWNITFGPNPDTPFVFESSDLPLIVINTNSQIIPNDPRIVCDMGIIYNGIGNRNYLTDPYNNYNGLISIETRGSSSQGFPKKSYALETQNLSGNNVNAPLLGMPAENDWILYAPYTDKTLMRDALTYHLGSAMGNYAPRFVFCELFIDGIYQGVYCLEEKIKVDNARVDIAKLNPTDTLGDQLTGGYILKVDRDNGPGSYFTSAYNGTSGPLRIVFHDPDENELHQLQKNYIENYVADFEDALFGSNFQDPTNGFRAYADTRSFIDFFLANEISNNIDGYRLSTFLYKDKNSNDSLIHMGPLWDFNLAFGNANYCDGELFTGWAYQHAGACGNMPYWWDRMLSDTLFTRELHCRYLELRSGIYSDAYLLNWVDSLALKLDESKERNYEFWPILGIYVWPNYYVGSTYSDEIDYLKYWIQNRMAWLDINIMGSGSCDFTSIPENEKLIFKMFPNPSNSKISLIISQEQIGSTIEIYDELGKLIFSEKLLNSNNQIAIHHFNPGCYFVRVHNYSSSSTQKLIVIDY